VTVQVYPKSAGEKLLPSTHKHGNQSKLPPWDGGELQELFSDLKQFPFADGRAILARLVGDIIERDETLSLERADSFYKLCCYFGLPKEGIKMLLRGSEQYLVELYELSKSIHDVLRAYGLARTPFTRNEPDPHGVQTPLRSAVLLACDKNGLPAALWTPFGCVRIDSCGAGDNRSLEEAMQTLAEKFQLQKHYPKFIYNNARHESHAEYGAVFQLLANHNGQPLTPVCHAASAERLSLKWAEEILGKVRGDVLEKTDYLVDIKMSA